MQRKYDYLVVGSGLFGATFARCVTDQGAHCLVIDRRLHFGGNCYSEFRDGVEVHLYGPHVFHTNSSRVWRFVNRFSRFEPYRLRTVARAGGRLYSLPFSLQTLYEFYGETQPDRLLQLLEADRAHFARPRNLREQALNMVGERIYKTLIEGYTTKQWGRDPKDLPASIIKRLPIRSNYCVDYHNDLYQGLPDDGYTAMIQKMLDGIEVRLGVDYLQDRLDLGAVARRTVYTGPIDELFGYCYGRLEWRYSEFLHERVAADNFQGTPVVNYPELDVPWTRITEHKHFRTNAPSNGVSWLTKEISRADGREPTYPIETQDNRRLHAKYVSLAHAEGMILGGRLAEYRYYDMHQVVAAALKSAESAAKRRFDVNVAPDHSMAAASSPQI